MNGELYIPRIPCIDSAKDADTIFRILKTYLDSLPISISNTLRVCLLVDSKLLWYSVDSDAHEANLLWQANTFSEEAVRKLGGLLGIEIPDSIFKLTRAELGNLMSLDASEDTWTRENVCQIKTRGWWNRFFVYQESGNLVPYLFEGTFTWWWIPELDINRERDEIRERVLSPFGIDFFGNRK